MPKNSFKGYVGCSQASKLFPSPPFFPFFRPFFSPFRSPFELVPPLPSPGPALVLYRFGPSEREIHVQTAQPFLHKVTLHGDFSNGLNISSYLDYAFYQRRKVLPRAPRHVRNLADSTFALPESVFSSPNLLGDHFRRTGSTPLFAQFSLAMALSSVPPPSLLTLFFPGRPDMACDFPFFSPSLGSVTHFGPVTPMSRSFPRSLQSRPIGIRG